MARIVVPRRDSWSDAEVKRIDNGAAFDPWYCLAAYRPLGSIIRARQAIHPKSVASRSERNGCPIHDPKSLVQVE